MDIVLDQSKQEMERESTRLKIDGKESNMLC